MTAHEAGSSAEQSPVVPLLPTTEELFTDERDALVRLAYLLIGIATVGALVFVFDLAALLLHARATRWMQRAA